VSILLNILFFYKKQYYQQLYKQQELSYYNIYRGYNLLSNNIQNLPIDSNQDPDRILLHFVPLKESIIKNIDRFANGQQVGVYIQDATTGAWLGINENGHFIPASLLKVPIAMAIHKEVEMGALSFDDELIARAEDIDSEAGVPDRYTVGNSYKVRDLLDWMLKLSDNTAKNMLKGSLDPEDINSVFTHVGIDNPYTADFGSQYVSPRQYERMFKALYFSTYLKAENSQALLNLLTDTRVEGLLSARLPWEIQIAHKYGERPDSLHDCGIVYHRKTPYFICLMTQGIDISQARDLMSAVSLEVYDYFNKNNK
jgi:beta-lactamase class A